MRFLLCPSVYNLSRHTRRTTWEADALFHTPGLRLVIYKKLWEELTMSAFLHMCVVQYLPHSVITAIKFFVLFVLMHILIVLNFTDSVTCKHRTVAMF
jgi:hypothetical protein